MTSFWFDVLILFDLNVYRYCALFAFGWAVYECASRVSE